MDRPPSNDLDHGERRPGTTAGNRIAGTVHELLRCVSSGYPDAGGRCHAHVPAGAAREAWRQETLLTHRTEGFFHFIWRGERWLGYGTAGGGVRGVYCAKHCSQRQARIVGEQGAIRSEQQPSAVARLG